MLTSINFYSTCAACYVFALFIYVLNLGFNREWVRRIATTLSAFGFLTQTLGMAIRWFESGLVELNAYQLATGTKIVNKSALYWKIVTQHPPWSNLYEIIIYMSWGMVFVFLVCEIKWKPRFLNVFSLLLAVTALGISSLTDSTIKPLVPALKSWWIMLHVVSASVAYSAGTLGAMSSFLYVLKNKDRIPISKIVLYTILAIVGSFGIILINGTVTKWNLSLTGFLFAILIFVILTYFFPVKIRSLIPSLEQLDHIAYTNILISFILMAIVLITGALWAHYAWGRYWGWDPKETGALVIWITYAMYLHTRLTRNWVGTKSAIIGILGFFIIIAGFLGVNLGWFANGLHSYGNS